MRSAFSKFLLVPAIAAAAALAGHHAQAQTVTVPFNFTVHGQNYPAGVYTIQKGLDSDIVTVRLKDGKTGFETLLRRGENNYDGKRMVVRFVPRGDSYAFDSIYLGDKANYRRAPSKDRDSGVKTVIGE